MTAMGRINVNCGPVGESSPTSTLPPTMITGGRIVISKLGGEGGMGISPGGGSSTGSSGSTQGSRHGYGVATGSFLVGMALGFHTAPALISNFSGRAISPSSSQNIQFHLD